MNNWLNKLERKYGRFGIPNLTNILVAGQILVFAIELFIDRTITAWVGLNRFFLLQGQIWRTITFVFIPFSGGSILSVVLGIYFTWFVGTALEKEWGDFRYTLYFLLGMVGTVLAYRRDGQHLLSVPFAAAGLCHAVPGGTAAAVLRDPHPGEVFRLFCGGPVGVQLPVRAAGRQAELPAQYAERLGILWPHGLPQCAGLDPPRAVEAQEPAVNCCHSEPACRWQVKHKAKGAYPP